MQVVIAEEAPDEKPKQLLPALMPRPSPSPPPIFETQKHLQHGKMYNRICINEFFSQILRFSNKRRVNGFRRRLHIIHRLSTVCSRDFQGKMWSLETHRKRREKISPTRSGRYHELTMTVVPDTTKRRIVCGWTDGRRAPQRDTREREKKSLARELLR
jgi:hypothetical protein